MPGSFVSTRSSASSRAVGAVGDDDLAGVERVADPDAAAVMEATPTTRRSTC